jgi:hypothetical protein
MKPKAAIMACGAFITSAFALVGIICTTEWIVESSGGNHLHYHGMFLRDIWRGMTSVTTPAAGALVLSPVPVDGPRANPTVFEPPLAGTQMSSAQVRRIFDTVQEAGGGAGINLLVFGLGHDSAYWNRVNSGGYTIFVEDSTAWIETIQQDHPELAGKIFQYTYKTRLGRDATKYWHNGRGASWESLMMFDDLPPDSPLVQLAGKFDMVIVDAPMGMQW